MVAHASLTGADLHEPKGAASASANTVYVADGAGSGTWQKVSDDALDATQVFNINRDFITCTLLDVSTASSVLIPISRSCTLSKVTSVIGAAITVADSTVTVTKKGGFTTGTLTISYTGSAKGDIDTLTPVSNNTYVAGDWIEIATDGASTTTATITFLLEFTLT